MSGLDGLTWADVEFAATYDFRKVAKVKQIEVFAVVSNVRYLLCQVHGPPSDADLEVVGVPTIWWQGPGPDIHLWPKPADGVEVEVDDAVRSPPLGRLDAY